jgi:hypothetical protein
MALRRILGKAFDCLIMMLFSALCAGITWVLGA